MQPTKRHSLQRWPWKSSGGSKTRQWGVSFGNVTTWGEKTSKYLEDTDMQICAGLGHRGSRGCSQAQGLEGIVLPGGHHPARGHFGRSSCPRQGASGLQTFGP